MNQELKILYNLKKGEGFWSGQGGGLNKELEDIA